MSIDECIVLGNRAKSKDKRTKRYWGNKQELRRNVWSIYFSTFAWHCDRLDASTTQRLDIKCMSGRKKGMIVSGLSEDCSRIALAGFGTNSLEVVGTWIGRRNKVEYICSMTMFQQSIVSPKTRSYDAETSEAKVSPRSTRANGLRTIYDMLTGQFLFAKILSVCEYALETFYSCSWRTSSLRKPRCPYHHTGVVCGITSGRGRSTYLPYQKK